MVVVGDSYASGEGAPAYFSGTDQHGRNECCRTSTAYPYQMLPLLNAPTGHDGFELISVACSGARTTNLVPFAGVECNATVFPDGCPQPQYLLRPDGEPNAGYQIDDVPADADVVLVQAGAGDAQLIDIMAVCAATRDACNPPVVAWLDALDDVVGWRLEHVFEAIKARAPNADVIAVTYPSLLWTEQCGATRLDQGETDLLVKSFVPQLNETIRRAATTSGVRIADVEDALVGHELCRPPGPDGRTEPAATGIRMRPIRGISWKLMSWFHGSFHPNQLGHELLAPRVAETVNAALAVHRTRPTRPSRPPVVPEAATFSSGPSLPALYENTSPCQTRAVFHATVARPPEPELSLRADAGTIVCVRSMTSRWQSIEVDTRELNVPLVDHDRDGFGGWHEVLYRVNGSWERIVVVAPSGSDTASEAFARAWGWRWVRTLAGVIVQPLISVTLIAFVVAGRLMWCRRKPSPRKSRARATRTMVSSRRRR